MTTPTPDMSPAALEALAEKHDARNGVGHPHGPAAQPDALSAETAATLRALAAAVIRLRAECFRLAAGACGGHYGDDHGHSLCSLVDVQRTRAEAAEARVREAAKVLGDLLDDCEPARPGSPRRSLLKIARDLERKIKSATSEPKS